MSVKFTENGTKGKLLKVICQKCKIETNHLVLTSIEENGFEEPDDEYSFDWHSTHQIIKCMGCNNVSFRIESTNSEMNPDEKPEEIFYPEISKDTIFIKDFSDLPNDINRMYHETIDCYNNNILTLCGAGIRSLVEAICSEKKIISGNVEEKDSNGNTIRIKRKRNLEGKINGLFENGILTKENATILHEHRSLGNETLHEMSVPNKESLKIAINIIEGILEFIYEIPYKSERLKQSRNHRS